MSYRIVTTSFLILFFLSIFISPASAQTGFILGDSGTVLKTTNGGALWSLKPTGTMMTLWNAYFISEQTGWVVGGYESGGAGIVLKTTNNGENWIAQPTGISNMWFTGVFFTNSVTGYIIGEHGTVMKTTNAGAAWQPINSGITNILLESVNFTDSLTGWISGWTGTLFKTTNAGVSWIAQTSGVSYNLYTGIFPSAGTGYLAGSNGTVLKTTNSGNNWTLQNTGTTQEIFSVYFMGNNGWIAGNQGTVRVTTNGGTTWTPGTIGTTTRLETIQFIDVNTGWVVGGYFGSVIFKSTNSGLNWFAQVPPVSVKFYCVYFYHPPLGLETLSNTVPTICRLYQNYPNPFNPTTSIRFDVAPSTLRGSNGKQHVELNLYNESGESVAALLSQDLPPGSYEYKWDGTNYSSGAYFCKLAGDGFAKTVKMILVK
jgi:photosystem II stability/assembly factor-like uncharacterized protein